ncbi:cell division protein FtsQ/DivIB [Paracnuella aquatica]|uniref:cell division protein FtsQ/DivIB n=1 Tax=Paracnuella aquatica TaxID=2268757 RepID=UPI000DEEBE24|nr:cell division protein FtsQ/DivIB [Paracnuella aquatica]RPD47555.1 hypothetical protein DRJ53_11990 [Paracnuella aquatica]
MASKRTIKRIVLTILWAAITGGVITLLVAANGRGQQRRCGAVHITVNGMGERYFISKEDIGKQLSENGQSMLKGRLIETIDLAQLEEDLEQNAWIADAELYFDRDDELHVVVKERQPIARVFARNGTSFYIDSAGARLPLLSHISARVPVITGYPSAKKAAGPKDSAVVKDVRRMVQYISGHEFWSAQVAQIDIMPDWTLELLPTVGNHIIRLGNAEKVEEKLHRLEVFYKKVLSQAGFDKYRVVDVQYAGQVVAVQRGTNAAVDSVQLQKNIAALLKSDQMMQAHAAAQTAAAEAAEPATSKPAAVVKKEAAPVAATKAKPKTAVAQPVRSAAKKEVKSTSKKEQINKSKGAQQPKAVMPRRTERN